MRQTPFPGERGKLTLSQLQSEFRGPLQMIKGHRPIPRSARSYADAEREIMRHLRLGFPHRKTCNDRFSYATMPVFPMRKNPCELGEIYPNGTSAVRPRTHCENRNFSPRAGGKPA